MAPVDKTVARLCFGGDDLDPHEISRALGKNPTLAAKKGGTRLTSKGVQVVANTGIWILETDDAEPGDLDRQVATLFSGLHEDFPLWRHFARRYRGSIYTGIFLLRPNEGLSISPTTLNAIGLRGLELDLDIYGGDDDWNDATRLPDAQ